MECPACAAAQPNRGGTIAFCSNCGHRWLLTTQEAHHQVEEEVYTLDYAGYRPDEKFVAAATNFAKTHILERVPLPARVLDVGCGAGDFLGIVTSLGYDAEGIDISSASAQICVAKGLKARAGDFLTEQFDGKFDLIAMWDVVEHLRDPQAFFERARGLLSDRGYFLAKVPGFGDLSVRLSSLIPRTAGTLLGAPNHCQYFDRESLGSLLERSGFRYEWLPRVSGGMREMKTGGSLKRKVSRKFRTAVQRASGDMNLYFMAQPA